MKERFCKQYLNEEDEKYLRGIDLNPITKDRVAAKSIRYNFKNAVDSGKKVVMVGSFLHSITYAKEYVVEVLQYEVFLME